MCCTVGIYWAKELKSSSSLVRRNNHTAVLNSVPDVTVVHRSCEELSVGLAKPWDYSALYVTLLSEEPVTSVSHAAMEDIRII